MKTYIKCILIAIGFIFSSCSDVIDVDVTNATPRLVIEASIDWEKGTAGNDQSIKLSMSTPYFDSLINNEVIGASVQITNDTDNSIFIFTDQNDGNYTTSSFVPILNQTYTLEVIHNGSFYTANETLIPVVAIFNVNQTIEDGFDDEAIEVNVFFDDPLAEENYYLLKFIEAGDLFPTYDVRSDEFTNGNLMLDFFEKEEDEDINQEPFITGDVIDIKLYGISEQFHNYMGLLLDQYSSGGDPFGAIPAAIKGNCINPTNSDNYAFGYFRLSEIDTETYVIQ